LAAAALATVASAVVTVYGNSFNSRSQFKEIVGSGNDGEACKRGWRQKKEKMRVELGKAPAACVYKPPVQGSRSKPDHHFTVDGRILKDTAQQIRADAYLSVAVRVGGGDRYELRVFPKEQSYELRRQPNSAGFPVTGNNPEIGKLDELNEIRLNADGNQIRALVNGAELANITDVNADDLPGAKLEFGLGNEGDSNKDTVALIGKLRVSVPDP
jgi:hypothetical protein